MDKYYYQQGRCAANSYLSLNPILYTSTEEKGMYKKVKMACDRVLDGTCDRAETCSFLQEAPELVKDNPVSLRDRKLGE